MATASYQNKLAIAIEMGALGAKTLSTLRWW
jgi:hypothetical protein